MVVPESPDVPVNGTTDHRSGSLDLPVTVTDPAPDLSPTDPILQVLERYWGFREFRPWQREAIDAILARRDSVVVLPTGGGKSLCFQAPALVGAGGEAPRL